MVCVDFAAHAAMVFWLGSRKRHPPPDLRPTAAVLPFEANMIGGDNSNYSAMITEAVTSELARLGTISVASYTSAMQFEGQRRPMSEIAAALKSAYVVEASVDDEASEILIVARLVNAETDRKMWVSDYRGARDDARHGRRRRDGASADPRRARSDAGARRRRERRSRRDPHRACRRPIGYMTKSPWKKFISPT